MSGINRYHQVRRDMDVPHSRQVAESQAFGQGPRDCVTERDKKRLNDPFTTLVQGDEGARLGAASAIGGMRGIDSRGLSIVMQRCNDNDETPAVKSRLVESIGNIARNSTNLETVREIQENVLHLALTSVPLFRVCTSVLGQIDNREGEPCFARFCELSQFQAWRKTKSIPRNQDVPNLSAWVKILSGKEGELAAKEMILSSNSAMRAFGELVKGVIGFD